MVAFKEGLQLAGAWGKLIDDSEAKIQKILALEDDLQAQLWLQPCLQGLLDQVCMFSCMLSLADLQITNRPDKLS